MGHISRDQPLGTYSLRHLAREASSLAHVRIPMFIKVDPCLSIYIYITIISPLYHHYITIISPLYHHYITIISPLYHHYITIIIIQPFPHDYYVYANWDDPPSSPYVRRNLMGSLRQTSPFPSHPGICSCR